MYTVDATYCPIQKTVRLTLWTPDQRVKDIGVVNPNQSNISLVLNYFVDRYGNGIDTVPPSGELDITEALWVDVVNQIDKLESPVEVQK